MAVVPGGKPTFAILFAPGIMNVAVMLAVTALVFAEKLLPGGERTATAALAA